LAALLSLRLRTGLPGLIHPVSSRGNLVNLWLGRSLSLGSCFPVSFQWITFLCQRFIKLLRQLSQKPEECQAFEQTEK
jgi:hypothetical protein